MSTTQVGEHAAMSDLIAQAVWHQQQGRFAQAESLFRRVLTTEPEQPDALHFLGLLEFQTSRRESGLDKMRHSVERAPSNAGFHFNFASALLGVGRGAEALAEFQRCTQLEPANGDAWQGMAMALSSQDQPEDGISVLLQTLARQPRHRGCWLTLSILQENLNLLPEAIASARHALQIDPRHPESLVRLAALLLVQERMPEAGSLLDTALRAAPGYAEAHYHRANLLMSMGKFDQAQAAFTETITLDPDFTEAYIRLAMMGRLHIGTELQKKLEARAEHATEDALEAKLNIHFALGQAWQNQHDYARAFRHFATGNRLRRASLEYSSAAEREHTEHIMATYDAVFVARAQASKQQSEVPIFIVGMARSGTSLVEQILSRHPQVHAGGELTLLSAALHRRLGASFRKDAECSPATLSDADLEQISRRYLQDMRALAPSALHITDKVPGNYLRLGLVHVLFPQARIVHCRRDARDNCVSQFTTLFGSGHAYASDLTELGEYYRMYLDLMRHWHGVLPPGTLLDVRYEDLITDTETQVRRLLDHCRLDWNSECLNFTASTRPVRTASIYQVRQPIYHSSIGRWRHYEPYLGPLLSALKDVQ